MSVTAPNPLHDEWAYGITATQVPWNSNGGVTAGSPAGPSPAGARSAAQLQGTAPLTGPHNTPLHIAVIGVLALLVLWGLHKAGFRFGAEVSVRG